MPKYLNLILCKNDRQPTVAEAAGTAFDSDCSPVLTVNLATLALGSI